MAVAYVQSAKYTGTAAQTNMTFTLGTTPVVGNLLVLVIMYFTGDNPVITPSGWTLQHQDEAGQCGITVFKRVVQAGDTTSWNVTVLTVADQNSGAMVEVSGQDTVAPFNQLLNHTNTVASTSNVSASVTPSVLSCLALSFTLTIGSMTAPAITAGWTAFDQNIASTFQPAVTSHKTALTADTTTAITNTVTGMSSAQNATTIMLMAPLAVTTLPPGERRYLQAVTRAGSY